MEHRTATLDWVVEYTTKMNISIRDFFRYAAIHRFGKDMHVDRDVVDFHRFETVPAYVEEYVAKIRRGK